MKNLKTISLLFLITLAGFAGSTAASEFNDLTYLLEYPAPMGRFHLVLDIPGGSQKFEFVMPLVRDLPELYLRDAVDSLCTPGNPEFNPVLCEILKQILTSDALDWINGQWNTNISLLLGILPGTVTTRQLPWPVNTMGTLIMHDYGFEWPCSWNPQTGSFDLLPLYLEIPDDPTAGVSITRVFDFKGNGRIDRRANYRVDGLFDYQTGIVFDAGQVSISMFTGVLGEYTGLP